MIWMVLTLVVAVAPMAYRGWLGWRDGATAEMRHVIATLFAVLVAIRYWQPSTEILARGITLEPRYIAIGAFAALFAAAYAVASLVVKMKADVFRSVQPNPVNSVLGAAAGLFSGSLLGGSLVLLLTLGIPGHLEGPDAPKPPVKAGEWPIAVFRTIETDIARVAPESSARSQFPKIEFVEEPVDPDSPEAASAEPGMILVKLQPTLVWTPR